MKDRKESLRNLIKHLHIYTSHEIYRNYDFYGIPCIEEIKYDEVYHDLQQNMTIEVYHEYGFINILGLTKEELEEVEYILGIYVFFKGGE